MDAFLVFEPPPMLSLQQLLQRFVAVLITLAVHGWAAAWLSGLLGDPGPKHDGRRTISPVPHLDLVGFVFGLFYRVVWMTRVDVDPGLLRGRRWGAMALAAGASAVLAAASALLLVIRPLALSFVSGNAGLALAGVLDAAADVAIVTAVVNLVPLPPALAAVWAFPRRSWWHGSTAGWVTRVGWIALALAGLLTPFAERMIGSWRALLGY